METIKPKIKVTAKPLIGPELLVSIKTIAAIKVVTLASIIVQKLS